MHPSGLERDPVCPPRCGVLDRGDICRDLRSCRCLRVKKGSGVTVAGCFHGICLIIQVLGAEACSYPGENKSGVVIEMSGCPMRLFCPRIRRTNTLCQKENYLSFSLKPSPPLFIYLIILIKFPFRSVHRSYWRFLQQDPCIQSKAETWY